MPKFNVGDKFIVVHSYASSEDLQKDVIHTISKVVPLSSEDPAQFYETGSPSWQWYPEEIEEDNQLIIKGLTSTLAVLSKIEEPDT